jgi:hypothetical protein
MTSIPDKKKLVQAFEIFTKEALSEKRCHKERLIFRTYNKEYVNVGRRLPAQ